MLIGIIADTHDNLPSVEKAINRLNEEKVDLVLHAGDIVSPFVIPKFSKLNSKMIAVFGNNDGDHELLKKRFNEIENCEVRERFALINADGFKIALLHGDEIELLKVLIEQEGLDALVHGHEHRIVNKQKGKMIIISPGEVCGYLSGKSTLALLDTVEKKARIIDL